MFCKLFFTSLLSFFLFINIFSSSYGEPVDEGLIGDKTMVQQKDNNDNNISIEVQEQVVLNNEKAGNPVVGSGDADVAAPVLSQQETKQININTTATEVFKEQIEKAKNVSNIKVVNKVKYGSDIADEVENRDGRNRSEKVIVNRTTMKKNGPVNFKIDVKDSGETRVGIVERNIKEGYQNYMSGDYELAVYFYKLALKEENDSVEAQFGLGTSYQMLRQFDQAIDCYLKLLNKNFSRKKVVSNLLLALSHKSHKDALDILLTIDEKILGYDDVLSQIGVLYMRLGDNVKAITAFTKAFEIAPTNAIVCYNLGILYDREGNLDYTKYFWEQAIKNDIADLLSTEDLKQLNTRLKEVEEKILAEVEKKKRK